MDLGRKGLFLSLYCQPLLAPVRAESAVELPQGLHFFGVVFDEVLSKEARWDSPQLSEGGGQFVGTFIEMDT